ncbi:beta-alanyl-dopamine/carcinine hydrolase-like [Periplaneta americana]|uniref:beta-alanyl-dopamine/carcinine hydrolase-like n=1 Tax=Periplaneta americana TaxID=6978 RepID=UPI0037E79F31
MPAVEKIGRRNSIPVLYTRGTHYEVGFDVGRTFGSLIHSFLAASKPLNEEYLPLYETDAGKAVYQETLACVRKNFPQYVRELEGTADGAKVPFHKLFLLHMDDILPSVLGQSPTSNNHSIGCTSICCNQPGEEILGHTEDAVTETLNHIYFVSAHIISDTPQGRWKVTAERFTSLCYAGNLPGYTMSYNHHGFVFTINTISAKTLAAKKTPRVFLTRALLAAENFAQAQQILRDTGCGAGNAFSINMTFLNQEGDRLFHNAEVGPAVDGSNESALSIFTASPGEHIYHCNKYLRLQIPEAGGRIMESSDHRHTTLNTFPHPVSRKDVISMLGDQSDKEFRVFQESGDDDFVKTVAVGIFDCIGRTWSIYADNPKKHEPIVVLPLQLKSPAK